MEFDFNQLKKDLKDNFGTAMFNGFPMAVVELSEVDKMSEEELLAMADKMGMRLEKYCRGDSF